MRKLQVSTLRFLLCCIFCVPLPSSGDSLPPYKNVVGVVLLPTLMGSTPCEKFRARPISFYRDARSVLEKGKIIQVRNWTFPPEGGCEGLALAVQENDGKTSSLPLAEIDYEINAAIAIGREGSRLAIVLERGTGWIDNSADVKFIPVERMLKNKALVVKTSLMEEKNRTNGVAELGGAESLSNAKLISAKTISGDLWLLLSSDDACSDQRPIKNGNFWIPFLSIDRTPNVWLQPRGC